MAILPRSIPTAVALLLLAGPAWAQSTVTLKANGVGADRPAAVKDALADAVLQAAAMLVDSPTWVKEKAKLKERIAPKATAVVKSHEVQREEKTADGKVSVQLRAVVDKVALAAKLKDAGIKVEAPAASAAAPGLAEKIVQFCKDRVGTSVGDGECGTLAQEALKAAGAAGLRKDDPGPGDYVWGEFVFLVEVKGGKRVREPADAKAEPGDVIQYRDVMLPSTVNGRSALFLTPHHTAVVGDVKKNGDLVVYEQNVGGTKEVVRSTISPNGLRSGWIRVYRPVPK
jgi:hypothetical protein